MVRFWWTLLRGANGLRSYCISFLQDQRGRGGALLDSTDYVQPKRPITTDSVNSLTTIIGGGESAPLWFQLIKFDPVYWIVITLSFAGALCAEMLRRKTTNPESGFANIITGTVLGSIMAIVSLAEPKASYFTEVTRICLSFLWGGGGKIVFSGFVSLMERIRDDPKGLAKDISEILPRELLGEVLTGILEFVKRKLGTKPKDNNESNG